MAATRGRTLRALGWRYALEYLAWLAVFAAAAALFALAVVSPAFAQVEAQIEGREQNGYGRIILTFDRLPAYRNELSSGVLVLSFEEDVKAPVNQLTEALPAYIGMARRDPDGRAIRIALNRSFQVNLMEAGKQLYIDLLPPSWRGAPPSLPSHVIKELSALALAAEEKAKEEARQREAMKNANELKVRLLKQPTFVRLVFDWNTFATADLSRSGGDVTLRFNQMADVSLAQVKSDAPRYLRKIAAENGPQGLQVSLSVDDDVDVRGFREGMAYILDLTGPDRASDASVAELDRKLSGGAAQGDAEKPVPDSARDKVVIAGNGGDGATAPDKPAAPAVKTEVKPFDPNDLPASGEGAAQASGPAPAQAVPESNAAARPEPRAAPAPVAVQAPPQAEQAVAEPAGNDPAGVVLADEGGPNLRLTFPFKEQVASAVFLRGETIWIVFDSSFPMNADALNGIAPDKVVSVDHMRGPAMQYFRLRLAKPWLAYAAQKQNSWVVDIGDMVTGESEPLALQRRLREDKQSLIAIKLAKPGRVHWIADPAIGDNLAVVTALAPARSVAKPQDFVEFAALPTAHGVAVRANSDDIAVRLLIDEVVITRRNGLTLSAGNAGQYSAGRKSLDPAGRAGFLDFASWGAPTPKEFSRQVGELQRKIAELPAEQRNEQRFRLARLFAAQMFAPEAVGTLDRMMQQDPDITADPAFNALLGAELALMGRTKEARATFETHALVHDPDASLWRGFLDVQEKDWETALRSFSEGADAITAYRPDMQAIFRLAAARAAIEAGKLTRAADEIDAVPDRGLTPGLLAEADLIRARYLDRIGRTQEALDSYDRVLKTERQPQVSEAEWRTIDLLLRLERISDKDALDQLERLQLVWRGDDNELNTMRLLAKLNVKQGNFRAAFNVMKSGLMADPDARPVRMLQDDMRRVFEDIYLHGKGDTLSPVEALALFYDFRELTPVGRLGDEMIRRLADRLIQVELLDQATELLDHQVNKRLNGSARSQVAARLAMVHLMNRKPELALRVIRQTRQAGLPNDFQRSRNLLEARALGELGRAEAALEILNTMEGPDAERLKADALWSSQKWKPVGEQLEKMLAGRWKDAEPLSDIERFDVLRAAIGYSLAEDQFALDRLQKKYYAKMVKTSDAASFMLVTKPVKVKDVTFRDLAREIAAIDTLNGFLKEFRSRYDKPLDQGQTSETEAPATTGSAG
ncbi:MAG: tetratricopeptide repeat protein [Hyphomicrobiales bacterium]